MGGFRVVPHTPELTEAARTSARPTHLAYDDAEDLADFAALCANARSALSAPRPACGS